MPHFHWTMAQLNTHSHMEKWQIFTFIPWFLKKNAFSENLIRTKFILYKIFFRMILLSSSRISWMFFNYIKKNDTSRFSAYNNYYCQDKDRSFEVIFMKFTWLVQVHTWVNIIFFLTIGPIEPLTWKNGPQNFFFFFWLSFSRYGVFWVKKFKAVVGTPFPIE